jgi:hypothetical protein
MGYAGETIGVTSGGGLKHAGLDDIIADGLYITGCSNGFIILISFGKTLIGLVGLLVSIRGIFVG